MGRGLALQFKAAFPDAFDAYVRACKSGEVRVGKVHAHRRSGRPSVIFHFPTKRLWREPSRIEWVRSGLADLASQILDIGVTSVGIPALGCGLGGLKWWDVEPLIREAVGDLPGVSAVIFGPEE